MTGNPGPKVNEAVQLKAFFSNYFQFILRSRALAIPLLLLALALFLTASAVTKPGFVLPPSSSVSAAAFLGGSLIVVASTSAFMGGFAIGNDLSAMKTASVFVLSLPVRRRTIFLGRYMAALVVGLGVLLIYYLFTVGLVLHYYGSLPSPLLESFVLAALFMCSAMGMGFMFSALLKTERNAMFANLLLIWVAMPLIGQQLAQNNYNPIPILTYAASTSLTVLEPGYVFSPLGSTNYTGSLDPLTGALVMAAYLEPIPKLSSCRP